MTKQELKQFDKFLEDNEIHFVNPVKDEDKNLIIQFISKIKSNQRKDYKRATEHIIQTAKTGDMKFDWALDEIIHSVKYDLEKILKTYD